MNLKCCFSLEMFHMKLFGFSGVITVVYWLVHKYQSRVKYILKSSKMVIFKKINERRPSHIRNAEETFISSKISTSVKVFLKKKKDFPVAVKWMSIFEGFAFFGNSTIVYLREICVLLSAKFHPLKTIVTYLAWIKL